MSGELTGLLLIGGASRRMGRPKHLMPIAGTPAYLVLTRMLQAVTGRPAFIAGAGALDEVHSASRIPDRDGGGGPLAGLLGFWDQYPQADLLLLATDLPAMSEAALRWLIAQSTTTQALVCRPRFPERPFGEPLAAVYRAAVHPSLEAAWTQGIHGIHRTVPDEVLHEPGIPEPYRLCFTGANDGETWARLQNRS